jgi:para-nitrobenzyl esterase
LARGLFQRVIGESGAQFEPMKTLPRAEEAGAKFGTLRELRAKPAEALQSDLGAAFVGAVGAYSGPRRDGWSLPEDVYTIYAKGKQTDVPLLIGSNADEGTMFTPANVTLQSLKDAAQQRYGPDAEAFLKLYPAQSDTEAWRAQANSMRDQVFGWGDAHLGRGKAETANRRGPSLFLQPRASGPAATSHGRYFSAEIAYDFSQHPPPGASLGRKRIISYRIMHRLTG